MSTSQFLGMVFTPHFLGTLAVPMVLLRFYHFTQLEFLGMIFITVSVSMFIYHFSLFLYRNWIGVALGRNADLRKMGKWAVITGSTDGIGKAYSEALAKLGINIILISRSLEKLTKVSQELEDTYNIKTKVVSTDFTGNMEIYEDIKKEIQDFEVGILINNVGMAYPYPEYFVDLPNSPKFLQDLVNCNILSVTGMTSLILPGMVERRKGVIINVGSICSTFNTPFMTAYSASKAFLDKFTQDLALEYKQHGIIFQSLIPGYIVSNMSKVKKSTWFVPTPEDFVECALKLVGLDTRTPAWIPHQLVHGCLIVTLFFRKQMSQEIAHSVLRQVWLYGKKVMMLKEQNRKTA